MDFTKNLTSLTSLPTYVMTVIVAFEQVPGPRPDRFALQILLFRARRNFFPSSPGACSQATVIANVMKSTMGYAMYSKDIYNMIWNLNN